MRARPPCCPSGPATWRSGTWPRPGASCRISAWPRSSTRSPGHGVRTRARPAGTYLALAALNRLVAPCSKAGVRGLVEDHRRGPVHQDPGLGAGSPPVLGRDARCHAGAAGGDLPRGSRCGSCRHPGVDCSSVALDMTNFATFIDTANGKAPVAQRGKAKQKRSDLRLVGLGLVVTRDGGIPLTWHAYPGDRPDVTQFPAMIDQLLSQYQAVCAAAAVPDGAADMTVVFDAGQNSEDNFAHLASTGLHYVGSVPASDCPDLTALPASVRVIADEDRFGGLTAYDTRRDGLRRRTAGHPHPLPGTARLPGRRVRPAPRLAKAGKKLGRAGRHPGPRQDPPRQGQGGSRDRVDHPQTLGPPGHHLAAGRRPAQGPAPAPGPLDPAGPRRPGRRTLRQARADHRSRRLARPRGDRRRTGPSPRPSSPSAR